jgi:hypothetical protein
MFSGNGLGVDWNDSVDSVECTDVFSVPDDEVKYSRFVNHILKNFKFVMVTGLMGTGKEKFISLYAPIDISLTLWDRDVIWKMIDSSGAREESYWGAIENLEREVFPKVALKHDSQILLKYMGRTSGGRRKYLNILPPGIGYKACLVFDGPIDRVLFRNISEHNHIALNMSEEDFELHLRKQYNDFQWPKFSEGWDAIYYINTFGEDGERYLSRKIG